MAKTKSSALKIKKKNWFKIFAPKNFKSQVLGESLVDSAERLTGKSVKINLSVLTGDMKKQGTIVKFKITNVRPEGGNTEAEGYELLPAALKRHMRRGVKTIANSFECTTADGARLRIKPIIFTRNHARGGILKLLNKTAKFSLIKIIKGKRFEELFSEVIAGKLQRELREKLNKIFPVRMVEIKALLKVSGEGKAETEEEQAEEMKEEEETSEDNKEETEDEKPAEKKKNAKKEESEEEQQDLEEETEEDNSE